MIEQNRFRNTIPIEVIPLDLLPRGLHLDYDSTDAVAIVAGPMY